MALRMDILPNHINQKIVNIFLNVTQHWLRQKTQNRISHIYKRFYDVSVEVWNI